MTLEEAFHELKIQSQVLESMILYNKDFEPRNDNTSLVNKKNAIDIGVKAIEKQIPKKVEIKPWNPARCPSCGYELSESIRDGYYKHHILLERCPVADCGQRFIWSEVE